MTSMKRCPIAGTAFSALLLLSSSALADDAVPRLEVEAACRAAAGADPRVPYDAARCLKSESDARDQLVGKWTTFPAADRTLCTQTATMGGTASYVELITCLELKQDVARTPRDPRTDMQTKPSSSVPAKP